MSLFPMSVRGAFIAIAVVAFGVDLQVAKAEGGSSGAICSPCAQGGNGIITVQHGRSDVVPGRGAVIQGRGDGRHDYFYIKEYDTPACTGNGLNGLDLLCSAAVNSCPATDQIRFWIWHQRVDVKVGNPDVATFGPWIQEQGSFCLGPDDPGVPNIVTTLVQAYAQFEKRVRHLAPPGVRTTPGPRTLVQYETAFLATNAEPFDFGVTVAGTTVHLNVRPASFRWTFGDATTAVTPVPRVRHTYVQKGPREVRVDITWGGSFTVGRSAATYAIAPPASVVGTPSVLTVLEARAENIQ